MTRTVDRDAPRLALAGACHAGVPRIQHWPAVQKAAKDRPQADGSGGSADRIRQTSHHPASGASGSRRTSQRPFTRKACQ